MTVNDFILGCISKATCLYSQGSQERITVALSASMHAVDKDLNKFKPSNEVVAVPIILRLKIDLASAVDEASKATVRLRDSDFASFLYSQNNDQLNHAPIDTFNSKKAMAKIRKFEEDNIAFAFSNMAASQQHQWSFSGKKTQWAAMTTAHVCTHISLVSLHDSIKLAISSKRDRFDGSRKLLDMIERIIVCDD